MHELKGKVFGELQVLERSGTISGRAAWLCKCACGVEKIISSKGLIEGTKSCGCLRKKLTGSKNQNWRGFEEIGADYWSCIQAGAKSRDLDFLLTIKEGWALFSAQKKKCALTGWDISFDRIQSRTSNRKKRFGTASLDRIDSKKGYVLENVQWVHKNANIAKNALPDETFIALCKAVASTANAVEQSTKPIICLSGAFDILHVGHVRMFQGAAQFGRVVVVLNSDEWVRRSKGFVVMSWEQRKQILLSLKHVDEVVGVDDADDTVCSALLRIRPLVFGNGGIRTQGNTPERTLCLEHGIRLVYGLGGGESDAIAFDLREKIRGVN